MNEECYVYILANDAQTSLYVGSTKNLIKKVFDHKEMGKNSSCKNINPCKLVYYQLFTDISQAILREKEIKGYTREKKNELVETFNPNWYDLYFTVSQ